MSRWCPLNQPPNTLLVPFSGSLAFFSSSFKTIRATEPKWPLNQNEPILNHIQKSVDRDFWDLRSVGYGRPFRSWNPWFDTRTVCYHNLTLTFDKLRPKVQNYYLNWSCIRLFWQKLFIQNDNQAEFQGQSHFLFTNFKSFCHIHQKVFVNHF